MKRIVVPLSLVLVLLFSSPVYSQSNKPLKPVVVPTLNGLQSPYGGTYSIAFAGRVR